MNSKSPHYMGENSGLGILDWNTNAQIHFDIRLFYFWKDPSGWTKCRWDSNGSYPSFYWQQQLRNTQICYSADALKNAQTAFLVSIINVQQADLLISKTRTLSLGQQLMINNQANFGLFFETALIAILVYVPWIGDVLGTRMLAFPHFMAPSLAWFTIIVFYDEVRKIHSRRGMRKSKSTGVMMYDGWLARNTIY